MKRIWMFGIAALAASTTAFALVTFDPATGSGAVGKGDVQLAFGWNNAALQRNAAGLSFAYTDRASYEVTCEWDTVTGKGKTIHHVKQIPRHRTINGMVQYDARVRNQIVGFILTGYSSFTASGEVPVVGASCPGNNPGLVTGVLQTAAADGQLSVTHNGTSAVLWTEGTVAAF